MISANDYSRILHKCRCLPPELVLSCAGQGHCSCSRSLPRFPWCYRSMVEWQTKHYQEADSGLNLACNDLSFVACLESIFSGYAYSYTDDVSKWKYLSSHGMVGIGADSLNLNYEKERLRHRPPHTPDIRVSDLTMSDIIMPDIIIDMMSDITIYPYSAIKYEIVSTSPLDIRMTVPLMTLYRE